MARHRRRVALHVNQSRMPLVPELVDLPERAPLHVNRSRIRLVPELVDLREQVFAHDRKSVAEGAA
jgi:hypothetical protein